MDKVISVKPLEDYLLEIKFADGLRKVINIGPFIGKGISAALKDKEYFRQVTLEEGGALPGQMAMIFARIFCGMMYLL